jgi:hypothetical protein
VLRAPAPYPCVAACRVLGPDSPARACTGPVLTIDGFPLQRATRERSILLCSSSFWLGAASQSAFKGLRSRPLHVPLLASPAMNAVCPSSTIEYTSRIAREPEEVELAVNPEAAALQESTAPQAARGLPVTGTDWSDAPRLLLCRVSALGKTHFPLRFSPARRAAVLHRFFDRVDANDLEPNLEAPTPTP